MSNNMFRDCDAIEEVVGQAVGAASVCWERIDLAGTFDSDEAAAVTNDAIERIRELIIGAKVVVRDSAVSVRGDSIE